MDLAGTFCVTVTFEAHFLFTALRCADHAKHSIALYCVVMAAADSDGKCVTQRQTKSGPPNKKKKTADKRYAQREIPATKAWRLTAQTALANAWHESICLIH